MTEDEWPAQRCPECADGRPVRFGETVWDADGRQWVVRAVGPAEVAAHLAGEPGCRFVLDALLLDHGGGEAARRVGVVR